MDASLFPVTRRKYLREKNKRNGLFCLTVSKVSFPGQPAPLSSYDIWETEAERAEGLGPRPTLREPTHSPVTSSFI